MCQTNHGGQERDKTLLSLKYCLKNVQIVALIFSIYLEF